MSEQSCIKCFFMSRGVFSRNIAIPRKRTVCLGLWSCNYPQDTSEKTKEINLGSGGMAAFQCYYAAYCANCEQEIPAIQSGHRLTLVYELCYPEQQRQYSVCRSQHLSGLRDVLSNLPDNDGVLLLALENRYTEASVSSLSVEALKGKDRHCQRGIDADTGGLH